jgi:hypothetical protein
MSFTIHFLLLTKQTIFVLLQQKQQQHTPFPSPRQQRIFTKKKIMTVEGGK